MPLKLDPAENAPLLARLLDISLPQDARRPYLAPDELRRRQLTALTAMVVIIGRIEDLHSADPTTLDMCASSTLYAHAAFMHRCAGHSFVAADIW